MLAGERFGDRPASVCPVIGAILRAYNDNVDERRRQDLYRFAADAVDTRRDYRVQRRRADAALEWAAALAIAPRRDAAGAARSRGPARRDRLLRGRLAVRRPRAARWLSDDEHAAMIALLEALIEIDREPALDALIADAPLAAISSKMPRSRSSTAAATTSSSSLKGSSAARNRGSKRARRSSTSPRPLSVSEVRTTRRSLVGALALDETGGREPVEHLGHARRAQVGGIRQVAHRHLAWSRRPNSRPYCASVSSPGRWVSRPRSRRTAAIARLNDRATCSAASPCWPSPTTSRSAL